MDSAAILAELPRLRRYARALVGDRMAADDLVQDTLERAWSRLDRWRPGSDLRTWLFAIMHNLRIDQLRRQAVECVPIDEDAHVLPVRASQSDRIELDNLAAALARVPEEQRAVLLLISLEEMSYAEVAAALGIPLGTVMSRLCRGREHLRQILAGDPASPRLKVVR